MLKRAHFIQDTSQGPDITRVRPDRTTQKERERRQKTKQTDKEKVGQMGKFWGGTCGLLTRAHANIYTQTNSI